MKKSIIIAFIIFLAVTGWFLSGSISIGNEKISDQSINKNSTVGAGSVITKNVKKSSLALTRSSQIEIKNYKRKK